MGHYVAIEEYLAERIQKELISYDTFAAAKAALRAWANVYVELHLQNKVKHLDVAEPAYAVALAVSDLISRRVRAQKDLAFRDEDVLKLYVGFFSILAQRIEPVLSDRPCSEKDAVRKLADRDWLRHVTEDDEDLPTLVADYVEQRKWVSANLEVASRDAWVTTRSRWCSRACNELVAMFQESKEELARRRQAAASEDNLVKAGRKYHKLIVDRHCGMTVRDQGQEVPCALEDMFIAPPLHRMTGDEKPTAITVGEIPELGRVVLTGPSGAGKSTLLQRLACRLALDGDVASGDVQTAPVPIVIERLGAYVGKRGDLSLRDYAVQTLLPGKGFTLPETWALSEYLKKAEEEGRAVYLLDEWDGVPVQERSRLRREIRELGRWVVATRSVSSTGLAGEKVVVQVEPWSLHQVRTFLARWEAQVGKVACGADRLLAAIGRQLRQDASWATPLMVTLACGVGDERIEPFDLWGAVVSTGLNSLEISSRRQRRVRGVLGDMALNGLDFSGGEWVWNPDEVPSGEASALRRAEQAGLMCWDSTGVRLRFVYDELALYLAAHALAWRETEGELSARLRSLMGKPGWSEVVGWTGVLLLHPKRRRFMDVWAHTLQSVAEDTAFHSGWLDALLAIPRRKYEYSAVLEGLRQRAIEAAFALWRATSANPLEATFALHETAGHALKRLRAKELFPDLLEQAREGLGRDRWRWSSTVRILGQIGDPSAEAYLRDWAELIEAEMEQYLAYVPDMPDRLAEIVTAIGETGRADHGWLRRRADGRWDVVTEAALAALGRVGGNEALNVLLEMADDDRAEHFRRAQVARDVMAKAWSGPHDTLESALVRRVGSGQPETVKALIGALERMGDPDAPRLLLEILARSPVLEVKEMAAGALSRVGGVEGLPELVSLTEGSAEREGELIYLVSQAMSGLAKKLSAEHLVGLTLDSTQPDAVRWSAVQALAAQGGEAAAQAGRQLVTDGEHLVWGAYLLETTGDPDTVLLLLPLVGHPAPDVRRAAAKSLGRLKHPEAVRALLAQLAIERDRQVRTALIGALGEAEAGPAVETLSAVLTDESSNSLERRAAIESLARIGGQRAEEVLSQAWRTEPGRGHGRELLMAYGRLGSAAAIRFLQEEVRASSLQAEYALRAVRNLDSIPALVDGLADSHPEVRRASVWALGAMLNDARAMSGVLTALADEERDVRGSAQQIFRQHRFSGGRVNDRRVVVALEEGLDAPQAEVRCGAAQLLARAEVEKVSRQGVERLLQMLTDGDEPSDGREMAAAALGSLQIREARAALRETLLSDADWKVRRAATEALGAIGCPEDGALLLDIALRLHTGAQAMLIREPAYLCILVEGGAETQLLAVAAAKQHGFLLLQNGRLLTPSGEMSCSEAARLFQSRL